VESEIADCEVALGNFVSVEETLRVTGLLEAGKARLQTLMAEWEQVAEAIDASQ
jgi:hypothetical protein